MSLSDNIILTSKNIDAVAALYEWDVEEIETPHYYDEERSSITRFKRLRTGKGHTYGIGSEINPEEEM